jgi:short-subunit dehydrogenase
MTFEERYGPWALITGASSGIGAEFSRQLAAMGLNLVLVARRKRRIEELAGQLERTNQIQVKTIAADLSQSDFLPLILSSTHSIEIGLLVNNAGFGLAGKFLDHELEKELALLDVNCRAPLILSHVFGRQMAQRKRGGIIFISSVSGYIATPFEASYAASKAYELFLAESLGYELKHDGVDVLALCPGSTDTEFHAVAGSRAVAAMAVQPVVDLALKKLGKKPAAIPGWHNRLSVYSLKFAPRRLYTFFAGRIMEKLVTP